LLRRNIETGQKAWEMAGQATGKIVGKSMQQMGFIGQNGRRPTNDALASMEAVMESGAVVARGVQNISREVLEFAQMRMQLTVDILGGAIVSCRTPQDFLAAQSELARGQLELFVQTTRRVADISAQMADDADANVSRSLSGRQ
jgi:hypothetical protein